MGTELAPRSPGQGQQAIAAASRAIERDPRDPIAPRIAGLALLRDLWARPRDGPAYARDVERLLGYARQAVALASVGDVMPASLLTAAEELATHTLPAASDRLGSKTMRHSKHGKLTTAAATAAVVGITALTTAQTEIGPHRGTFVDVREVTGLNTGFTNPSRISK